MFRILAAAAVAFSLSTFGAQAATQEECDAAIAQAQQDAENNVIIAQKEQKEMEFSELLAKASEEGVNGDYDKCLQWVHDARGGFGLEQ